MFHSAVCGNDAGPAGGAWMSRKGITHGNLNCVEFDPGFVNGDFPESNRTTLYNMLKKYPNNTVFPAVAFLSLNPFKVTRCPDAIALDSIPGITFTFIFTKRALKDSIASAERRFHDNRMGPLGESAYALLDRHLQELRFLNILYRWYVLEFEWSCSDQGRYKQVVHNALGMPDLPLPANLCVRPWNGKAKYRWETEQAIACVLVAMRGYVKVAFISLGTSVAMISHWQGSFLLVAVGGQG